MTEPRRRLGRVARGALVALFVLAIHAPQTAADPDVDDPPGRNRILIESVDTAPGRTTRVRLEGWPPGPVTVAVCGNDGVRASQDCDLIGAKSLGIETDKAATTTVRMTPPVGCPCVVRVATKDAGLVRHLPVVLPDVPMLAPDQRPPDPLVVATASQLHVSAVVETDSSVGARVRASLAGPVEHTAVVTLRNTSGSTLTGLTMTAATGRDASGGEPLPAPAIGALAAGEERVVRVPFTVGAPSAGGSVVAGRIIGLDRPIPFEAGTEVRPWGLYAIAAGGLVLLASRRRRRQRRTRRESPKVSATETASKQPETIERTPRQPASASAVDR